MHAFKDILLRYDATNHSRYDSRRVTKNGRDDNTSSSTSYPTTLLDRSSCSTTVLHRTLKPRNRSNHFPNLILIHIEIHGLPTLHQHLLHTRQMKIISPTLRPIRPAEPLPAAAMTRARELVTKVEMALPIVKDLREASATRMKIEVTGIAMVHKAMDVSPTSIAYALGMAWGVMV